MLDSTWEELRGILAAETLLHKCHVRFGNECRNNVGLVCDSKGALDKTNKLNRAWGDDAPFNSDMEIVLEI